ncbi:MAG: Tfp pilus assembly protein FimT/FimU [Deltaproteobacteria bacterium]
MIRKKNGYTLIELLIVMLIVIAFAGVVCISFSKSYNGNVLKNNAYLLVSKLNYYKLYCVNNNTDIDASFYAGQVTFLHDGVEVDKIIFSKDCVLDFPVSGVNINKKGFVVLSADVTLNLQYKGQARQILIGKYNLKVN